MLVATFREASIVLVADGTAEIRMVNNVCLPCRSVKSAMQTAWMSGWTAVWIHPALPR